MNKQTKIGLIEDQKLFREGIIAILNNYEGINTVFQSPDGFSVIDRLSKSDEIPDVMLIDLTLPMDDNIEFNGWEVLSALQEHYPEMGTLILSVHDDEYLISKTIEEGAQGYLVKDSDPETVYEAIKEVHEKGAYINSITLNAIKAKLKGEAKPPKSFEQLSSREIEVLKLICEQKTSDEIAKLLFISPKTVHGHRNSLLQKTESRNTTGLVIYAIKHGLIQLS